jgi:phosphosulfolactate synthase
MHSTALTLPERETKPRVRGLTMMIDNGLPTAHFLDVLSSFADLIDVVKFGWGTSLVTNDLKYKIDSSAYHDVDYYFGGTLFEKFVAQGRFDDWRRFCDRYSCRSVEVSNGTIPMTNEVKAGYVAQLAGQYRVFSEVGYKDSQRSEQMPPQQWVEFIAEDIAAGAYRVITEAREGGRSGICHPNGELRSELIETIAASGISPDELIFEAPTRELQITLIKRFGPDVSLGNISPADLIGLETLRLGLRNDTFDTFDSLDPFDSVDLVSADTGLAHLRPEPDHA